MKGFFALVDAVAGIDEVRSIGKSGGEEFPEHGESDIDVFVFCRHVPDGDVRRAAVQKLGGAADEIEVGESASRFWGICDYVTIDGTEVCLMYFAIADMDDEIESVMDARRLDREGEYFYPTGRCASFLSIYILCDKDGYIADKKRKLSLYPPRLSQKLFEHHIEMINDEEDFKRAVSRGDVLFYHATLETAIDHFLQALFARNKCFFPSRKRTTSYIDGFTIKPTNCAARLLQTVELASKPETLGKSYSTWTGLCRELATL